jgi:hypothetical protein
VASPPGKQGGALTAARCVALGEKAPAAIHGG